MASTSLEQLINSTGITAGVAGSGITMSNQAVDFVIWSQVTNNSGTTPTLDATIQHSPDGGTTWETLKSITQVTTGTATEVLQLNSASEHVFPLVRVNVTLGGTTPNYDVQVKLFFRQSKG